MLKEFKTFVMRGNVLDLAIGIIIGGAFGKIITSFVNDILMPPIGLLLGKVDFSSLFVNLSATTYPTIAAAKAAGAPTINYGIFLNHVIDFLLVSLAVFILIRQVNRLQKGQEEPVTTKECPFCTSKISIKAVRCPHCTSEIS